MSPSAHAKLSPSAADRWLSCPASIGMTERHAPGGGGDSIFAREGTIAHALAELEAGLEFGLITRDEYLTGLHAWHEEFEAQGYEPGTLTEMQGHVINFVAFIKERLAKYPNSKVFLEQRMDSGVPKCWGTSDVVIVSLTHIEIIDLKYGSGVPVSAIGNPQLRLYGCGAYDTFGWLGDILSVTVTVYQPRVEMNLDEISETLTVAELLRWREEDVMPRAELALGENAPFGPTPKACRWCPVSGICLARVEAAVEEDFGSPFTDEPLEPEKPEVMSPEQMGLALKRLPEIRAWCTSLEEAALETAYTKGIDLPGWKVVMSGGKRVINDHAVAIQTLIDKGYNAEQVSDVKIKGIGVLEKLIGKKEFPVVLEGFIDKTTGRESLVPDTDSRTAISPASAAADDFS